MRAPWACGSFLHLAWGTKLSTTPQGGMGGTFEYIYMANESSAGRAEKGMFTISYASDGSVTC